MGAYQFYIGGKTIVDLSTMKNPYISIVIVGRNDNYGGDFKKRLQTFVTHNHQALTQSGIAAEIIFVNYNPLLSQVPIEKFIQWPSSTSTVPIRIITVPPAVHQEMVQNGNRTDVPVMEYLAKNAGIRRAKGEFILSMNPDIILPTTLVNQLNSLREDTYYRTDRVDFSGDILHEYRLLRVFLKGQNYPLSSLDQLPSLRRKNKWLNRWRAFTPRMAWLLNMLSIPVYYNNIEHQIHCNVSGDFMLMHRKHWLALNGHTEQTPIALHVDALTVAQAKALGLKEHVFETPIFHQEHTRRYDATVENPQYVKAYTYFVSEAKYMLKKQSVKKYNDASWGLSKFDLPETNP